jgi:hypothetical protein
MREFLVPAIGETPISIIGFPVMGLASAEDAK